MLVTIAEADTYFSTRLRAQEHWNADTAKGAALQTAENMLAAEYTLPATATVAVKNAIFEQALFLLRDPDVETRASLRAQGVTEAGIVQETYAAGDGSPICPYARQALAALASGTGSGSFAVER